MWTSCVWAVGMCSVQVAVLKASWQGQARLPLLTPPRPAPVGAQMVAEQSRGVEVQPMPNTLRIIQVPALCKDAGREGIRSR